MQALELGLAETHHHLYDGRGEARQDLGDMADGNAPHQHAGANQEALQPDEGMDALHGLIVAGSPAGHLRHRRQHVGKRHPVGIRRVGHQGLEHLGMPADQCHQPGRGADKPQKIRERRRIGAERDEQMRPDGELAHDPIKAEQQFFGMAGCCRAGDEPWCENAEARPGIGGPGRVVGTTMPLGDCCCTIAGLAKALH